MTKCDCKFCKSNQMGNCKIKEIEINKYGTCKNYKFSELKYKEDAEKKRVNGGD